MSSIDFVSSKISSRNREEIKERRENVLAKAERKAKKAQAEKDKASGFMLPDVEDRLFSLNKSDKSSKKSHKEKKRKKEKKSKKKRKKYDSSSDSSSESEDEWVEKSAEKSHKHKKHKKEKKSKKKRKKHESSSGSSSSDSKDDDDRVEKESSKPKPMVQRESWMDFGTSFDSFGAMAAGKGSGSKDAKRIQREKEEKERTEKLSQRELNPVLRQEHIQKLAGGDKDLEMIKRAIDRVYAQAKLERKTVEEIATKRWGSMDKFNEMLIKVKKSEEKTDSTDREEPITSHQDRSHDRSYDRSRMVASKSGWKTSERREKERSEHHNRVSNEEQEKEM